MSLNSGIFALGKKETMKHFLRFIPNLLTLLNLICGALSIHFFYHGFFMQGFWLVMIALLFDFSDGFAARLLNARSDIGRELDSLADVISFGLAPGVAMFHLVSLGQEVYHHPLPSFVPFVAFLIPAFSALRLARFNIDRRQTSYFIGLPTPANALLIVSLFPLITRDHLSPLFPLNDYLFYFVLNPWLLTSATILPSVLLLFPVKLFSLKFHTYGWKDNRHRYLFLGLSAILAGLFWFTALPFIILLYFIISLLSPFAFKHLENHEVHR